MQFVPVDRVVDLILLRALVAFDAHDERRMPSQKQREFDAAYKKLTGSEPRAARTYLLFIFQSVDFGSVQHRSKSRKHAFGLHFNEV